MREAVGIKTVGMHKKKCVYLAILPVMLMENFW